MLAIGGWARYVVSVCQTPPKLIFSSGSFSTGVMSGHSGSPLSCGYSIGVPKRPANASCSCGVSFCSRKKMTRWSSRAWRISPITASSSAAATFTPRTSAPSAPLTGTTSM